MSLSVSKLSKVSAGSGTNEYFGCVLGSLQSSRREEGPLTVHGLQSDQTRDEVVEVDGHVGLRVAQDDQLEQGVGQLEPCERERWEGFHSLSRLPAEAEGNRAYLPIPGPSSFRRSSWCPICPSQRS